MIKHPCVILAGGKSSRMKKDKALLPFGNYPTLAQFQYEKCKRIFKKVYISSKENRFNFECDLLLEDQKEFAPIFALLYIAKKLKEPFFVLPVDMPFVDKEVFFELKNHFKNDGCVVEGNPLLALYHHKIEKKITQHIFQNNYKLKLLLKQLDVIFVKISNEKLINLNYEIIYM